MRWKWNDRKRRSIHDRAWPRETLIQLFGPLGSGRGPFVAAYSRFV